PARASRADTPRRRTAMEIRKVGVLGAGQMGLGIAQASARAGFDTILVKATPGSLDAERGKLSAADQGALLQRLRWSTHLHDLSSADIVIESIVEDLATKRESFQRL